MLEDPLPPTREADRPGWFAKKFQELQDNVGRFITGKPEAIRLALICMVAEGHLLIEDNPGLGKTSLARALAASINGKVKRIQFTPDLLPADITGTPVWRPDKNTFEFRKGPVFAHVVVGDEINRASPKTQSALLEVMEERQVTMDGVAFPVEKVFVVIATQNPIELEGTYRLPEAQIDRFMMRIAMGYPDADAEASLVRMRAGGMTVKQVGAVMGTDTVEAMTDVAREVRVDKAAFRYAVEICRRTRVRPEVRLGVSPRGTLALVVASKVRAASNGLDYVDTDDIRAMVPHVLSHRILLTREAELGKARVHEVLQRVVDGVDVPEGSY